MDALGWIVAIVVVLLFGKNLTLTAANPLGQDNSVPTTADNLPVMSDQNQQNTPANQPAPWRTACAPSGQPIGTPITPVVKTIAAPLSPVSYRLPLFPTGVKRINSTLARIDPSQFQAY